MRQPSLSMRAVLAAALCVTSLAAAAQSGGDSAVPPAVADKQKAEIAKGSDPARWHTGDDSYQARLQILKKEIGAAYAQAKTECGKLPKADRAACLKDAQATVKHDLAAAPELAKNPPEAEVTEKRVIESTVPPPPPNR
jgi:hypothetical protein